MSQELSYLPFWMAMVPVFKLTVVLFFLGCFLEEILKRRNPGMTESKYYHDLHSAMERVVNTALTGKKSE